MLSLKSYKWYWKFKINILDALRLISNSWDSDITESIIKKHFKSCEFFNIKETAAEATHKWDLFEDFDNVNWAELKDFMSIDENIHMYESLSDEEIVQVILDKSSEVDSDVDDGETAITLQQISKQKKRQIFYKNIWRVVRTWISHYFNVFTNWIIF